MELWMKDPAEMQPHELMQIAADFFESQGIGYRVVGSLASMAYGEPRFTNDVDMVVELTRDKIAALLTAFPAPEYYVSEQAVREAVDKRFQFNIIHPTSGLKLVIIVPADSDFARSEASRIRRITSAGEYSVWFGSPEDVILNKLIYFQISDGTSEKHLRDIRGMMDLLGEKLDRDYLAVWANKLGITAEWQRVIDEVGQG
jgi:hypothetical protein